MTPDDSAAPLEIYLLGLVPFDDLQRLQRRLVYDLGESRRGGALVLCEHPPTISVGRSGSRAHVRADDVELREMDVPIHWVNRGGGCVLHLPGQLAAYLALPLDRVGRDLRRYVRSLEDVIVRVLAEFDLAGMTNEAAPGVFLGRSRVATVGVAVSRWIAYHGLTLNVGPYLEPFTLIEEPGLGPLPMRQTSMEAQRQRAAPMPRVREALIRQVEAAFGLERSHVYTHHPLIARKAGTHVLAPSPG